LYSVGVAKVLFGSREEARMKVLFLDVDGVLNSADWFHKLDPKVKGAIHELDPKAVKRVQHVLEVTGAVIVLSSTWRKLPELRKIIEAAGLPIFDITPSHDDGHRGDEIIAWLEAWHGVEAFAIIDDDTDAGEGCAGACSLAPRFVRTHWKHGMYGKHEKQLIAILGEK